MLSFYGNSVVYVVNNMASYMMHALLLMKNDVLVPRLSNLDYQYDTEFRGQYIEIIYMLGF